MLLKRALLCVIMCNLVCLGWTAEGEATAGMPTVMEAIVRAMIDFRKEILNNLQLSLEYHTEQLEEIKVYVENKMIEQEKRMKMESEIKFKELREEINISLDRQKSSLSFQMQDLQNQSATNIKMLLEVKIESESKFKDLRDSNKMFREETKPLFDKNNAQIQEIRKTLNAVNSMSHFGGGWTMFQRRIDRSVDFHRNWTMYKHGFGNINGEHWLGLEKLYAMTKLGRHELLVLLEDFEGNSVYAFYDEFKISSEVEKYKLTVGKYSGTAGDSLNYHNGMMFSTFDEDNDGYESTNCAEAYEGGWWYRKCFRCNLNGIYFKDGIEHSAEQGLVWQQFRGMNYSLKSTIMMLRSRTID